MRNNKLKRILIAFNVLLLVTLTSGFLAPVPHATENIAIDTVSPPKISTYSLDHGMNSIEAQDLTKLGHGSFESNGESKGLELEINTKTLTSASISYDTLEDAEFPLDKASSPMTKLLESWEKVAFAAGIPATFFLRKKFQRTQSNMKEMQEKLEEQEREFQKNVAEKAAKEEIQEKEKERKRRELEAKIQEAKEEEERLARNAAEAIKKQEEEEKAKKAAAEEEAKKQRMKEEEQMRLAKEAEMKAEEEQRLAKEAAKKAEEEEQMRLAKEAEMKTTENSAKEPNPKAELGSMTTFPIPPEIKKRRTESESTESTSDSIPSASTRNPAVLERLLIDELNSMTIPQLKEYIRSKEGEGKKPSIKSNFKKKDYINTALQMTREKGLDESLAELKKKSMKKGFGK